MPLATRAPVGLVAALLLLRLADESAGFLFAGEFPAFRHDLGFSYAQASAVLAAAAPGAIVGNAFSIAADYVSRRVIAAGGAFGFAAALLLFATGHSFVALAGASFLYGMAATALVDGGELALVELAGDELDATLARVNLLGSFGDLLGPLAVIVASGLGFGWRAPFVVAAVAMAAYGVWLATLPIPPPHHAGNGEKPMRALAAIVRDRRVWFYAMVAVLLGPLDEPFLAFLIAFAERERHLPASAAVAIAMCSIAGSLTGFSLRARASARPPTLVRPATMMAFTAVVLVVVPSVPALAIAAFVFGASLAAFWNTVHARIVRLRPGQVGTVSAVITTVEFAAFGLPIAYGAAADRYGIAAGLACYAATAVALALLVIAAPPEPARDA